MRFCPPCRSKRRAHYAFALPQEEDNVPRLLGARQRFGRDPCVLAGRVSGSVQRVRLPGGSHDNKRASCSCARHDHAHGALVMHLGHWLGIAVVAGVVLFQAFVTFRVWHSGAFDKPQKVAQSKLIWLLPMLGSVIVFSVLTDEEHRVRDEARPRTHQRL